MRDAIFASRTISMLSVACAVGLVSMLVGCVPARAVDDSKPLTQAVQEGIREGKSAFSHATFDALLKRHVKKSGRVDYAGLAKDRAQLTAYLQQLASADISSLSRDHLLALLINAYNAYTLDLIVRNYPLESIKDLTKPWDTAFCEVGGESITLNNIEHNYLRPKELFDDPRMHFAINCASVGCPLLRAEAYDGSKIAAQLEDSTRTALRDPRYVQLKSGDVYLTKVLDWFKGDFVAKHGSLSKFLEQYVAEDVAAVLKARGDDAIQYLDYDWKLNDI